MPDAVDKVTPPIPESQEHGASKLQMLDGGRRNTKSRSRVPAFPNYTSIPGKSLRRPVAGIRRKLPLGLPPTLVQSERAQLMPATGRNNEAGRHPIATKKRGVDTNENQAVLRRDCEPQAIRPPRVAQLGCEDGKDHPQVPSPAPSESATCLNGLRLKGDFWEIIYDSTSSLFEDSRGLRYIALLIQHAATGAGPLHATELVALATGTNDTNVELSSRSEVLDDSAKNSYIKRLEEIGFARNTALAAGDYDRVAQLDEEVDWITKELDRARGKGHNRRAGFSDSAERARKAVSKAITETMSKLKATAHMEPLATHLSNTVRKGQWLSYNGDPSKWTVTMQAGAKSTTSSR